MLKLATATLIVVTGLSAPAFAFGSPTSGDLTPTVDYPGPDTDTDRDTDRD
ncbi:hypothetical protein [Sulfitobacter sp. S190]|uniref:hypothetical protein n=1 Tax=Sulfitobacter sp. S190 TaxID=2867022 RepID=UPI0021A6207C|nr:hypothetical protein [Sulfitobacter sp. S190]UWR22874.1 hypothetical protein K3756_02415 [Sulfitobacter sp. S190]